MTAAAHVATFAEYPYTTDQTWQVVCSCGWDSTPTNHRPGLPRTRRSHLNAVAKIEARAAAKAAKAAAR